MTDHPEAAWVAQQLREAFPLDTAPRHLVFDRDATFSAQVVSMVTSLGAKPTRTAPKSPWQNGVAERWVGSVRRELLDHVVVFNDRHLLRLLREYVAYQHDDRTHLGLAKATPAGPPTADPARVARPRVGQSISRRLHIPHATINLGYHRSGRTAPRVFVMRSITLDDRHAPRRRADPATARAAAHAAPRGMELWRRTGRVHLPSAPVKFPLGCAW